MKLKFSYSYIFILMALALVTGIFIFWQVINNYMLINETFALLLVIGSVVAKWTGSYRVQGIIFFLLLIPLFDLLSYSYTIEEGNTTTTYHSGHFNSLINPIVFLLLLLYVSINGSVIKKQLRLIFKGSDEEINKKEDREIIFYYDKFNSSTDEELVGIYRMYKDYPYTAKVALDKIKEERDL